MVGISSITPVLTKKELKQVAIIQRVNSAITKKNIDNFFLKDTKPIPEYIEKLRDKFITTLSSFGISKEILKQIKNAKTSGELVNAVGAFQNSFSKKETFPILKNIKAGKPLSLEQEQAFYKKKNIINDCVRYLHALFSVTSTKPEVVAIEKTLKEKYGIKLALLGDDPIEAQKILKAVQVAKEKGIKVPEEIIVTNHTGGAGQHLYRADGTSTILLPSTLSKTIYGIKGIKPQLSEIAQQAIKKWREFCKFEGANSTHSPIHMEMHEIMHQTHIPLLAFKRKKIPEKFMPTIRKISGYCATKPNATHEIYTELATKKVLEGLEPDEAELFKFLGGDI